MSDDYDAIRARYLMKRRGTNRLIQVFSRATTELETDGHGLNYLLNCRNAAQQRDEWNEQFEAFSEIWAAAFANIRLRGRSMHPAMRDAGLECLGGIRNDLRNDMWTDKAMQSEPSPDMFVRFFWAQVRQKMIYVPIMFACDVSRETAMHMIKIAVARREILTSLMRFDQRAAARGEVVPAALRLPETDHAMFEAIAKHIGEPSTSVEKIGRDLPKFLKARGSNETSLRALDEVDLDDAEVELASVEETTSAMLIDRLPVGSASALDEVMPDVLSVLTGHCLPELKKHDKALFAAFIALRKKIDKKEEPPTPEDGLETQHALRLLRACIEREFRARL